MGVLAACGTAGAHRIQRPSTLDHRLTIGVVAWTLPTERDSSAATSSSGWLQGRSGCGLPLPMLADPRPESCFLLRGHAE
jgi:hypothetical protein